MQIAHTSARPDQQRWAIGAALAVTIALTLAGLAGLLLHIASSIGFSGDLSEQALRQRALVGALGSGARTGLFLGAGLAVAWAVRIDAAGADWWHFGVVTTVGALAGVALGSLGAEWLSWSAGRPIWVDAAGGLLAGLLIGAPQSLVLWRAARERLLWTLAQGAAFAGVALADRYASRALTIDGLLFLPLIWFATWYLYHRLMGATLDALREG